MTEDSRDSRLSRRIAHLYATDAQFAAARPDPAVTAEIDRADAGLPEIVRTVFARYADRPALGQRAVRRTRDYRTGRMTRELLPRFETISYRQLSVRTEALYRALAGQPVSSGDRVCVLGFTSVDYATLSLTLLLLGAVAVPLQTSAAVSELEPIVAETEPCLVAASIDNIDDAVRLIHSSARPTHLLVFDHDAEIDDHRDALASAVESLARRVAPVVVETLADAIERGAANPPPEPTGAGQRDSVVLLTYTSGSTGTPKGVMYTERLVANDWRPAGRAAWGQDNAEPSITLCFLPMSHGMGRGSLYWTLSTGGTAYFAARSDLSTLIDDIALVRPTQLGFVPRVWDMLRDRFVAEVERRCTDAGADRSFVESEVRDDIRVGILGDRFVSAMVSSAAFSEELRAWVESLLDLTVFDGYGSTECGSVTVNGHVQRPPVVEYTLIDVPELGYFTSDQPWPRGELLVKSHNMFAGYYRRPEATADVLEDGWYHTGDIVAETGPDRLVYVDRRNNVLKLAQGEFVTVSKLEALFCDSPLVRQIYIHGVSTESSLLAVVVPIEPVAVEQTAAFKAELRTSMQAIARQAGLQSFEIPRDVLIEPRPFTLENGLLTGVRKLARPKLRREYDERLTQLYAELSRNESERFTVDLAEAALTTLDAVRQIVRARFGDSALGDGAHFSDFGGDSLSAVSFARDLEHAFGTPVPVGVILGPTTTLASLAEFVGRCREHDHRSPEPENSSPATCYQRVHGSDPTEVYAEQVTADRFIDREFLRAATSTPVAGGIRSVLLTGASGFLGRLLALEIARRLPADGTLTCLVRAFDDHAARRRFDEILDGTDPLLRHHFRTEAEPRIEILAGDRSRHRLGLGDPDWARLTSEVDLVVDAGALVNHVLPYQQMFESNVVGTAELIRFGLTTKRKRFVYTSTAAVGDGVPPELFDEDADIRSLVPTRPVDDGYANGYANGKWADEVLLRDANEHYGLPVTVFRCSMILAGTVYPALLNLPDVVTRLVHSVVATGLAPASFYGDVAEHRDRAHFDGLPVEFVAAAIAELTWRAHTSFETYHVVNHHEDGIGLDTYVDWLAADGHAIQRVAPYEAWLTRFTAALHALPKHQRHVSLLPLLSNYRTPMRPVAGSTAQNHRFRDAVRDANIAGASDIPRITPPLISNYVSGLAAAGLL
ncbi:thioester reductase domain-containing protein [Mycolicibacterium farcinogenes]|uniref:carboxylic acid reductase n=1 Tax=Mycolicibacterium farcinogenes TaxID=1802 RepID=UPI001C8E9DB9|nr:carboxylic acid reductase [Mycolicibacterium farcinogenes]QZH59712.1 thioester reductase domain-containing protein [Mycolicibacterium farcinogenes]